MTYYNEYNRLKRNNIYYLHEHFQDVWVGE